MSLTEEKRAFYENTMSVTRSELTELNDEIEAELAKVRERLVELQNAKKAALQMYKAACMRLNVPYDLEAEEEAAPVAAEA